jgi:hypothetical protein
MKGQREKEEEWRVRREERRESGLIVVLSSPQPPSRPCLSRSPITTPSTTIIGR